MTSVGDHRPILLGVEASCDETAAALVRPTNGAGGALGEILSNVIWTQTELHAPFRGVVPEIAARAHVERLDQAILEALARAGASWSEIDAVAATAGPGLIGGVAVGLTTAKAIASARGLPLFAINHLEGHALTPRLSDGVAFPFLLLLASGGHCQLLLVEALGRYRRLGASIDDAPGEAFDKLAKHLGLAFPGGPDVERWAARGDAARFAFPRPMLDAAKADMSFSGLKTAARLAADRVVAAQGGLRDQDVADLCAGFQAAVCDVLAAKTAVAVELARRALGDAPMSGLAAAGGVAANKSLRAALEDVAARAGLAFTAPPLALCTDNAAMIAWAGAERYLAGERQDPRAMTARPRWPLDEAAEPLFGGGKRGRKA